MRHGSIDSKNNWLKQSPIRTLPRPVKGNPKRLNLIIAPPLGVEGVDIHPPPLHPPPLQILGLILGLGAG